MRIGINSMAVTEFGDGVVSAQEVKLIELSLAEFDFINNGYNVVSKAIELKNNYGIEYTIHAPFQDAKSIRIDLTERDEKNFKVMKHVFEICNKLEAGYVVVHGGDVRSHHYIENLVNNLRVICKMASEYGIIIALENLFTNEIGIRRAGETPQELLQIVEDVGMDNLGVTIDVGHAYITAQQYGFNIKEYFDMLKDYIVHMHVHNNIGLKNEPWDKHLPITVGEINYNEIPIKADNVILEVKRGNRDEVLKSLEFLKKI
ncbi:MAG TPA: sugar phosphate isomerase/epimerase [Archaeoglobus profundus]|nr:sugar phosphate isomerase/epimerase [Archaeoglobus profundus]